MTSAAADNGDSENQHRQAKPNGGDAAFLALTKSSGLRQQLAWHNAERTSSAWCFSLVEELVRKAEAHCPDLIVLDLDSTGLEALEALTCLESLELRPRIVCLSRQDHSPSTTHGVLEIIPRDRLPHTIQRLSSASTPRDPLVTGHYLDLCHAGLLSVTIQLMFADLEDSEIQIYEGRLVNAFCGEASGIPALRATFLRRPQTIAVRALKSPPADQNIEDDPTDISTQRRRGQVAKVNLDPLKEIDGFIGTCLVDSESGMTLAAAGGDDGLNIEIAASGNSKVVKAKNETMTALKLGDSIEDILITLQKRYHLIRPLTAKKSLFLYLALDRKQANLALARHYLRGFEETFDL